MTWLAAILLAITLARGVAAYGQRMLVARLGQRAVPLLAGGVVLDPAHEGGDPGALGALQSGDATAVRPDGHLLCAEADGVGGDGVEQGLEVRTRAGYENGDVDEGSLTQNRESRPRRSPARPAFAGDDS